MSDDEIALALAFESGATDAIEDLLARLLTGRDRELAQEMLPFLASKYPDGSPYPFSALTYYRGMRASLNGSGSRWRAIRQFGWYRQLFELEIGTTRRQTARAMSYARDWSFLDEHSSGMFQLWRPRLQLRLVPALYLLKEADALATCDAAVFALFRAAYCQP